MARIRSIHPGIWTDDEFVLLQMAARLLFIGLLNECDDQGVFMWKPTQLKMRLLPADNVNVSTLLDELTKAGFIRRYAVNGSAFGAVRHFREFQHPKRPNAVHPITNEIRSFSGTKAEHNSPPEGDGGGTGGELVGNSGGSGSEAVGNSGGSSSEHVSPGEERRGEDSKGILPLNPFKKEPPKSPTEAWGTSIISISAQKRKGSRGA
jgi:hypothetical protein